MLQLCRNSAAIVLDYDLVQFCRCMVTTAQKQVQLSITAKPYLLPAVLLQLVTFWCMQTRCNKLEPCQVHVNDCKAEKIGVYIQVW